MRGAGEIFLFVTRTLTGGGAERFVSTFSSYLADSGYNVYVLSYEKTDNDYEISDNVNLIYMPERKENKWRKVTRITDTRKLIKRIHPNYIIPFINSVMFCSWVAALGTDSKVVYTVRVSPWHRGGSKLTNWMEDIVAKKSDAIMIQTKEQGEYFPEKYSVKTFVVPNPIPKKFYAIQKTEYKEQVKKVIMVGRLEKQKNYDLAINCISKLHEKYNYLVLEIYGSGSEETRIEQMISDYDLEGTCVLKGQSKDIENILMEADLFLMTTDYEGMPNALMEALAVGIPCLSSDCKTGPKDLIDDGKTGYLFKVGNLDDLICKMSYIVQNSNEANNVGKKGRDFILNEFTLENTTSKFMKMIDYLRT